MPALQDCGLRYEPRAATDGGAGPAAPGAPVAAALLLGGAHVHVQPGDSRLVRSPALQPLCNSSTRLQAPKCCLPALRCSRLHACCCAGKASPQLAVHILSKKAAYCMCRAVGMSVSSRGARPWCASGAPSRVRKFVCLACGLHVAPRRRPSLLRGAPCSHSL